MWLPWEDVPNQVRKNREPRSKELITELDNTNEVTIIQEELRVYSLNMIEVSNKRDPVLQKSTTPRPRERVSPKLKQAGQVEVGHKEHSNTLNKVILPKLNKGKSSPLTGSDVRSIYCFRS